ncbi:UDP-N-acetylglucosamine--N-acetylmuramyl-(pentapeptide) pyrophosphoryl-undecaprenol N-acetylglucosamine transferase [Desulfosarcina cetonica]|nr:UDP-N-acetylglucosamine--N-acetylmuramyl-(pentapeptide) pyrophosphoryl-undecaprenol N-acetylglucosamine transferase [Desulfosarcina cetonica]
MAVAESSMAWRPLHVVVAGGGTGGHLYPGIAVATEFAGRNAESRVLFVGAGRPLEKEALARAGFPQRTIAIEGIKGRGLWAKLGAALKIPGAVWASAGILADARADLVVAVGGYSAGPVALAAWLKGIPLVLCEQNTLPGITNRLLFPLARRVYVSFDDTRGRIAPDKKRVSGNPVRQPILEAADQPAGTKDGFHVLVVGGSQGAHAINLAVMDALSHFKHPARLHIVHQTGESDQPQVAEAYARSGIRAEVKAFFHDMAARYTQADLVVCRAGATTVAELAVMGKAALFVPFPFATDNHQEYNARLLVDQGAALMVLQKDLNGADLAARIEDLAADRKRLAAMQQQARALGRPDAARAIVDDCYQLLGNDPCI